MEEDQKNTELPLPELFSANVRALLYKHEHDAVLVAGPDGALLLHNRIATRFFGSAPNMEALLRPDHSRRKLWRVEDPNGVPIPEKFWPTARAWKGIRMKDSLFWLHRLDTGKRFAASVSTIHFRDLETGRRAAILLIRDVTRQQQAEKEIEQYLQDLSYLVKVSQEMMALGSPERLLQKAVETTGELLDAGIAFAQCGFEDGSFRLGAYDSPATKELVEQTQRVPLLRLYARLLFRSSLRLTDNALQDQPAWWGVEGGRAPLKGLLAARLTNSEGKADGWLVASVKVEGDAFAQRDEALLDQLASIVSLALQQTEAQRNLAEQRDHLQALAGELKKLNQTLEEQVIDRTRVAEQRSRQLLALAVQLAEVEERERSRIAGLLHEDLQQTLASARFLLQSLQHDIARDDKSPEPLLHRISELLQDSLSKARHLSYELSPPVLHQAGLLAALEYLARRMKEQHGLEVDIEAEGWKEIEERTIRALLYRTLQELLFNVVKHAAARRAVVRLSHSEGEVEASVSDEGRGFDPAVQRAAGGMGKGFGLLSIQERVQAMGGGFHLESAPGGGTRVWLTVPSRVRQEEATSPAPAVGRKEVPDGAHGREAGTGAARFRVLFADDHKVIRQGLVAMLRGQSDLQVVGEAANGREAVEMARSLHPNVIVMDVSMPGMDGIEATRLIKAELPDVRVIGLSMFEEAEVAERMRRAGAEAFISKAASSGALLRAIYGLPDPAEQTVPPG